MKTKILTTSELPKFLPHGWKKEVADTLGVHPITIKRHIQKGHGLMYDKIVRTAAAKYGNKKEAEK